MKLQHTHQKVFKKNKITNFVIKNKFKYVTLKIILDKNLKFTDNVILHFIIRVQPLRYND